jgi:hypothetical protein
MSAPCRCLAVPAVKQTQVTPHKFNLMEDVLEHEAMFQDQPLAQAVLQMSIEQLCTQAVEQGKLSEQVLQMLDRIPIMRSKVYTDVLLLAYQQGALLRIVCMAWSTSCPLGSKHGVVTSYLIWCECCFTTYRCHANMAIKKQP